MISAVLILILWTWNLTPLWVNIIATLLLLVRIAFKLSAFLGDLAGDKSKGENNGKSRS